MSTTTDKEKLRTLATHDKLLNLVVDNLPVVLFMVDRQGIIRLLVGDQVGRLPLMDADMVDQSIYDIYADVPVAISSYERGLSGESYSVHTAANGVAFDTHISPLHDETGETIGVIGVILDVSDQHRAEEALAESEARFQALFERAAIGVVLKRLDGQMFSFNPAFLNMLGFTAQEMSTYGYLDITHPKDKATSERLFRELVSGERENYTLEKRYRCKDGLYRWGRMKASLLKSSAGEAQYVIGMIEDITEQKEMETELAEVQRRLVHSRELDRLQLARELHDGPLQDIIGVTYQLKALENEGIAEYNFK